METGKEPFDQVYDWSWGKTENIHISGDNIVLDEDVPLNITSYYPFMGFDRFFSPKKESSNKIFKAFSSLNPDSDQQILKFIKEYGFIYFNIKRVYVHDEQGNAVRYSEPLIKIKNAVERFRQIVDLYSAINDTERTDELLLDTVKKMNPGLFSEHTTSIAWRDYIIDGSAKIENRLGYSCLMIITNEVEEYSKKVRPFINIDRNTLQLSEHFAANNLESAMFYMLFMRLTNNSVLRKCVHPNCGKYFFLKGEYKTKTHCDIKCTSAHSSKRNRDNNKEEINAKRKKPE